jgi:tRNA-dihydrouridine synthase B
MVGRAALGAPWRPAVIAAALQGRPAPAVPQEAALADLVAGHYQEMLGFYGRDLGGRVARKHLGWYLAEAGCAGWRAEVLTAETGAATIRALRRAFAAPDRAARATEGAVSAPDHAPDATTDRVAGGLGETAPGVLAGAAPDRAAA